MLDYLDDVEILLPALDPFEHIWQWLFQFCVHGVRGNNQLIVVHITPTGRPLNIQLLVQTEHPADFYFVVPCYFGLEDVSHLIMVLQDVMPGLFSNKKAVALGNCTVDVLGFDVVAHVVGTDYVGVPVEDLEVILTIEMVSYLIDALHPKGDFIDILQLVDECDLATLLNWF